MDSNEYDEGSAAVPAVPTRPPDIAQLARDLGSSARDRGIALTGEGGLLTALTKQVLQSVLEAEMAHHLGYDKHAPAGRGSGNSRNGTTPKTGQGVVLGSSVRSWTGLSTAIIELSSSGLRS